jgi:hypothetical protein
MPKKKTQKKKTKFHSSTFDVDVERARNICIWVAFRRHIVFNIRKI